MAHAAMPDSVCCGEFLRSVMLLMSSEDPCDREFGDLYLKGFVSEESYRHLRRGYYASLRTPEVHQYHKPSKVPSKFRQFLGRILTALPFRAKSKETLH